ncbi:hypothetical protein [Halosaccharopolyspora lacisalsi]|uniref:hypothetical protein n=1 Tax=Halosaccharopolyspora lacisalsi TaxID=1000566 RepID=UPI0015FCC445|nr:hypothetical protein [Halosaccharopolyspora lacisalsi]
MPRSTERHRPEGPASTNEFPRRPDQRLLGGDVGPPRQPAGHLDEEIEVRGLDQHNRWPAYETLHIDARRLIEELAQVDHDLAHLDDSTRTG